MGAASLALFHAAEHCVHRPLQLGRSGMNGLSEGHGLVTHGDGLEAACMSFHATGQVACAGLWMTQLAEVDLHAGDEVLVAIQRAFDHSFDPIHQFLAAIDVGVDIDPDLHLGAAQFVTLMANVAKNMPRGHPPVWRTNIPLQA
jgi:hypothetical protein